METRCSEVNCIFKSEALLFITLFTVGINFSNNYPVLKRVNERTSVEKTRNSQN